MNEFYSGLQKIKKINHISADNKHEKFQMKGNFFKEYYEHGRTAG